MKTFVIYILILMAALTASVGDASSQVNNGTADFNAEYAPSGFQFSEDGFDIRRGISRKKWKKAWEKQKKKRRRR